VLRAFTGIESQKLLFAATFAGPEEYDYAFKKGATVLVNNIFSLKSWPYVFKDRDIFLSKLGEKESRLTHIKGIEGRPDNTICCVKRLAPVEKGDILLITNTGACGSDQGLGLQALEAKHQHYLRARKMCSVKI
jgi:hypothetical protein